MQTVLKMSAVLTMIGIVLEGMRDRLRATESHYLFCSLLLMIDEGSSTYNNFAFN